MSSQQWSGPPQNVAPAPLWKKLPLNVVNPVKLTVSSKLTSAEYAVAVAIATLNPGAALRIKSPILGSVVISVFWVPTPIRTLLTLAPSGNWPVNAISPASSILPLDTTLPVKFTSLVNVTGPSNCDKIFC